MGPYNCELSGIRVVYISGVLKLRGRYSSASTVCGVCYRNIIVSVVFFFVHSDEGITEVETGGCIYAPSNGR